MQIHVPDGGQSSTVQGELLRACEKLRDESQRNGSNNGNGKWDDSHLLFVQYILETLAATYSIAMARAA